MTSRWLPRQDGLAATRAICATGLPVRVLLLTSQPTTNDLADTQAAVRAGACGFLAKDLPPAHLVAAIRAVAAGQAVLEPRVLRGRSSWRTRAA